MKNTENIKNMDHFVDFHTHILPSMDDGSPDILISTEMLKSLKEQGVKTVILTPHFYTDREDLQDFLNRRSVAFKTLQPIADQFDIEVIPACEMYLTDYIFNYENITQLCINSKKYLLTELPFAYHFSNSTIDKISRLIANLNVVPVLAHIERYPQLIRDTEFLYRLINMGCLTQINLESLTGGFLLRKTLLNLIKENLVHVVGTDCHNLTSRPPQYVGGIQIIVKKLGREYVDSLMNNAMGIIQLH